MSDILYLLHTSPNEITKVHEGGRFGEFLCCSEKLYHRNEVPCYHVYSIDVDDSEIIDACKLFYHADAAKLRRLVRGLAARLGLDDDDSIGLIGGYLSIWDRDCGLNTAELSSYDCEEAERDIRHTAAKAAKLLGYRGVRLERDEEKRPRIYLIDMLGYEMNTSYVGKTPIRRKDV